MSPTPTIRRACRWYRTASAALREHCWRHYGNPPHDALYSWLHGRFVAAATVRDNALDAARRRNALQERRAYRCRRRLPAPEIPDWYDAEPARDEYGRLETAHQRAVNEYRERHHLDEDERNSRIYGG